MQRPLKRGILIILSKDIDKYAFMCGSNFYETDVMTLESASYPLAKQLRRPSKIANLSLSKLLFYIKILQSSPRNDFFLKYQSKRASLTIDTF